MHDLRDERRAVCNDCHVVVKDSDPWSTHGEFVHPSNGCAKSGDYLSTGMPSGNVLNRSSPVTAMPFMRKSERRRWSRAQRRAQKLAR